MLFILQYKWFIEEAWGALQEDQFRSTSAHSHAKGRGNAVILQPSQDTEGMKWRYWKAYFLHVVSSICIMFKLKDKQSTFHFTLFFLTAFFFFFFFFFLRASLSFFFCFCVWTVSVHNLCGHRSPSDESWATHCWRKHLAGDETCTVQHRIHRCSLRRRSGASILLSWTGCDQGLFQWAGEGMSSFQILFWRCGFLFPIGVLLFSPQSSLLKSFSVLYSFNRCNSSSSTSWRRRSQCKWLRQMKPPSMQQSLVGFAKSFSMVTRFAIMII